MPETPDWRALIRELVETDPVRPRSARKILAQLKAPMATTTSSEEYEEYVRRLVAAAVGDPSAPDGDLIRRLVRYQIQFRRAENERLQRMFDSAAEDPDAELDILPSDSLDLGMILAFILENLGLHGAVALDEFTEMLEDEDTGLHLMAAAAFDQMGALGSDALPRILDVLATRGVCELPFRLGEAVVSIARQDDSVLPELIRRLRDGSGRMREAAIEALGRYGVRAKTALRRLRKLAKSGDEYSRGFCELLDESIRNIET